MRHILTYTNTDANLAHTLTPSANPDAFANRQPETNPKA
jgi:hypothetical protein